METKELISKMLKEPTGMSYLDSGDAYGRNWQRNKTVDFEQLDEATVDTDMLDEGDEITVTIDLYHYLNTYLETDQLTDEFNTRFEHMDDWDGKCYGLSQAAIEWLEKTFNFDLDDVRWLNSYNSDSSLSQIIQFAYLNDDYVLLQVHGGCDARGGYTDAKLFKYKAPLECEYVSGYVTYPDGRDVDVVLSGYGLIDTNTGDPVLYEPGMTFNLFIDEP